MAVLDAPTVAPSRTEPGRKRQWGAERSTTTLPIVHRRPSSRTITLGRLAMIATVLCWAIYVITTVLRQLVENDDFDLRLTLELVSYLVTVTFLTFSALMYMLARQGRCTASAITCGLLARSWTGTSPAATTSW